MEKKKLNPLEDPPTASSSDDEEVDSSSEEEEEEAEEQISDDDSSSEEDESKAPSAAVIPGRTAVASATKQGSDSGSGSDEESDSDSGSDEESDSDSETEGSSIPSKPGSKKAITVTVAKPKEKEVRGSPAAKTGKKRESEMSSIEVNAKRAKQVSEDAKKTLFQRLWSEEDEISLLQGIIDFKADNGKSPYQDMNEFFESAKKSISFDASKNQFMDKLRSLKKKYMGKAKKSVESYSKPHDKKCLKLAMYIWGSDGMALESAVKSNVKKREKKLGSLKPHAKEVEEDTKVLTNESKGTPKKSEKKLDSLKPTGVKVEEGREELVNGKKVEEDKGVLINGGDSESLGAREYSWFESSFLGRSIASLGMDEHFVKQRWSKVPLETKKRIEEKCKMLQAKEMEIVSQKTDILNEVCSVITKTS